MNLYKKYLTQKNRFLDFTIKGAIMSLNFKQDSNGIIKKLSMIDMDLKITILIDNSKIAYKFNECKNK